MEDQSGKSTTNQPEHQPVTEWSPGQPVRELGGAHKVKSLFYVSVTLLPWLIILALFSLVSDLPRVPGVSEDVAAAAGHFIVYAVLAALIYLLHMRGWSSRDRRPTDSAFIAAGIAASVGLLLEWSQQLLTSSRAFQTQDVIANAAGAISVSVALVMLEMAGYKLKLLMPAILLSGAGVLSLAAASYVTWDPTLAYAGDHWHAAYGVVICGEPQLPFDAGPGSIHTHGDGLIHIHPRGDGDEGTKANLEAFFRSSGGVLTNNSITLPNGATFVNGDRCPDGSIGAVSASLFDLETASRTQTTNSPADFVMRNSELILIEFGPEPS